MSYNEHLTDSDLKKLHNTVERSTEGGKCLSRHPYKYNEVSVKIGKRNYLKEHSCNHRWQGFKNAIDNASDYNGNWYKPFIEMETPKFERVVLIFLGGKMVRRTVQSKKPRTGQWDITEGGDNYRTTCNRPYWHEAHHIVPNGALANAIQNIGKGDSFQAEITKKVQQGLLQASYNLNHKRNMIILPIEAKISKAIGLPIHVDRMRTNEPRHGSYNDEVENRLNRIFQNVRSKVDPTKHEIPQLVDSKTQLESLSDALRIEIKGAGLSTLSKSLDEHFQKSDI